ncbi:hypothetical protein N7448_002309 [Penicillium atrosanguineum]|uniref:Wax synthase domain-containing protein n=1 Tax=Penicillium atrosanguineum TaxID=1132637 RepID=A0A9W9PWU5_9EURO|nr:uncharacterized protein N7443_005713 [Penicillium atrosanguineum]KAJ5128592.1 hypothetical protein N7526_006758 [Penicillium atrosanguineum]KAJ5144917.1 hypothetical protein N7448_002309 [Penicillium atrosanguineum]KAJ5300711.1 hypothetical protein N7443_005713 [Penicillium atrosanguineum]KAJ5311352.1 hypothetical protein N7476_007212 [Penicillium atrosanguineum]
MGEGDAPASSHILQISGLYAIHCLIPATLLIATSKQSIFRYLSVPCSLLLAHQAVHVASALGPGFFWCELVRLFVTIIFQCLNLLLINPKDNSDVPAEVDQGLVDRLYYATSLFTQPRGVNTAWQVKNCPSQPQYYQRRGWIIPPRDRFLIRQIAIAVWQYLALDVFATLALQQALEQKKHETLPPTVQWDLSVEQWIERIISNLVAGFVVSRILIDFHHRAFSIIIVGLRLDSPSNCPPLFGKAANAYTLRGFWGKFWHQLLRQPLTSVSKFITRDLLGLPSQTSAEKYMNIFTIFFFSGALHVVLDTVQGIPADESGAMLFFSLAPLGLLIEDGIRTLWRAFVDLSYGNQTNKKGTLPMWQKTLGFLWTMVWLGVTSTCYLYPQMLRPQNQALVPYSLASQVGLPVVGLAVVVGGAIVAFVFEVEI